MNNDYDEYQIAPLNRPLGTSVFP